MGKVLVYSDKLGLSLELLTAAKAISSEVKAVALNDDTLAQGLANAGAKVLSINNNDISSADVAAVASVIEQVADKEGATIVLLSSNRKGKELAGRLAQKLGAGCLTDVSGFEISGDKIECRRNALGGATVATQVITTERKVFAIAPRSFEPASSGEGSITNVELNATKSKVKVLEVKGKSSDTVDIEAADIIVAVGQGLNSADELGAVEQLAKILGGEVACTKPVATDKKWLQEERVIGLSGKICKPELAILLGISGQVQFTVGIRDAKTIVAINTDDNANINQMADYILNADLHQVVKELNSKL